MQTEQAILRAVGELCRNQSFDKVSVRDICKAAGITTGAFYHHFRSKEDLLVRGFSPMDDYMSQALAGHEEEPIPERLRILLIAYASFIESQGWELVSRYYQHRLCDPQANLAMDPSRFTLGAMEECLRTAEAQGLLTREVSAEWTVDFFFRHFRLRQIKAPDKFQINLNLLHPISINLLRCMNKNLVNKFIDHWCSQL